MYIILEYYIMENFLINFLVLYSTYKITKSKIKIKRIVMGTLISTLYSVIVFFPSLLFMTTFIFKLLTSAIIVYITFKSRTLKSFFYQWLVFFIVSFVFAGTIIGLSFNFTSITKLLYREINLYDFFTIKQVIYGVIIALIVSLIVFSYNNKKKQMEKLIIEAKILLKNKDIEFTALVDTGNSLKDPMTNRSVFVVELSQLLPLLPQELIKFYKTPASIAIEDLLVNLKDEFPLVLVPFKSIGNDNGIILGFRPDAVFIKLPYEEVEFEINKLIIGIYNGNLSSDSEFSGLLDYETIVQREEIWLD